MSEIDHELCRYLLRDQAVRAAEDAAAVPAIQHRDLPEVVAALTERVARLEAAEKQAASTEAMKCMTKFRRERDEARAERDAAIRERDEARAECERMRACADPFGEELAVIAAWERCAITADWPADEPETAVRCAASMEQEIVRLRARVAELEAAPPPRGWLTAEERGALKWFCGGVWPISAEQAGQWRTAIQSLLARETPPMVRRPEYENHSRARDCQWIAAIRAAGVEVEG